MAAVCFVAVALGAVFLGRTGPVPDADIEPEPSPHFEPRQPAAIAALLEPAPAAPREGDPLKKLPLFAGLDDAALADIRNCVEEVELDAGSYLLRRGDPADSLYVVRGGRLQAVHGDIGSEVVVAELGRGEVIGELGLLIDAPRSASIRAVRDSTLVRLTKAQFNKIADARVLRVLVEELAARLHNAPPPAAS
jgi:hypothetical protein